MINYVGTKVKGKKVIVIADGPSKSLIVGNPELALGYSVALVNQASNFWEGHVDYHFSLHPEGFVYKEGVTFVGFKGVDTSFYINLTKRNFPGGSSTLFAVDCLLSMGYEQIDVYGLDLGPGEVYRKYRKFWKPMKNHPVNVIGVDWYDKGEFA